MEVGDGLHTGFCLLSTALILLSFHKAAVVLDVRLKGSGGENKNKL